MAARSPESGEPWENGDPPRRGLSGTRWGDNAAQRALIKAKLISIPYLYCT